MMHDLAAVRLREPQAMRNLRGVKSAIFFSLFCLLLIVALSYAEAV
ncbi:Uncharacterised protein [Pragia fontium]|nr:Uncharacterised protein [Pragia fontium]